MNPDLRVALVCVAGLVLLTYVYPVFQLKALHRAGAHLRLVPTARERIDARFVALIDPLIAALGRLGFAPVGFLDGPGDPAKSGIRHTIVLRTGDGTTGAVIYVAEQVRRDAVHLATGVQFSTEFTDGGSVNTGNSPQPRLFRYRANRRVDSFPGVRDLAQLYDLHRRLLARVRGATIDPQAATLEETIREIQETTARDMAYQEECGDYARADDGSYRLTWKGAIRAVSIMGAGLKALRLQRDQQRAAALAAELRRDPPP